VKTGLTMLFGAICLGMILVTAWSSVQVPIWRASFSGNSWAWATLADAYCGFVTFFCWVAWRERSAGARVGWFVGIMLLGNIAMSAYVLLQLIGLKNGEGVGELFRRKAA
jgi:Protein of unknown function (DUF1475)